MTQVADLLNQYPELRIIVKNDDNYSRYDQYHLGLAERRAYAVKFALINRGISSTRIITREDSIESRWLSPNQTQVNAKPHNGIELIIFKADHWL